MSSKSMPIVAMTLLLIGCCDERCQYLKFTDAEREEYERLIVESGPGWSYWFPRPIWHRRVDQTEYDDIVGRRVREGIAFCSGGLQIRESESIEIVFGFESFIEAGFGITESVERAIEGVAFDSGDFKDEQSVEAYQAFTGCIISYLQDARISCLNECKSTYNRSMDIVLGNFAHCMNENVYGCTLVCIERLRDDGFDGDDCKRRVCRREEQTNLSRWAAICEEDSDFQYDRRGTNEDLQQCEAYCG